MIYVTESLEGHIIVALALQDAGGAKGNVTFFASLGESPKTLFISRLSYVRHRSLKTERFRTGYFD